MKITLIGFMGSGKTTIGKGLADKLGYVFSDLDKMIEEAEGTAVNEIFKTKGEDYFRKLEREHLKKLLEQENCVIATGGGTPCFFDNMLLINKNSVSVYLKISSESLFERLVNDRANRPLIKELSDKELRKFISDTLEKREPYYLKSHYKVKSKEVKIGALADFIRQENMAAENVHIR